MPHGQAHRVPTKEAFQCIALLGRDVLLQDIPQFARTTIARKNCGDHR